MEQGADEAVSLLAMSSLQRDQLIQGPEARCGHLLKAMPVPPHAFSGLQVLRFLSLLNKHMTIG